MNKVWLSGWVMVGIGFLFMFGSLDFILRPDYFFGIATGLFIVSYFVSSDGGNKKGVS